MMRPRHAALLPGLLLSVLGACGGGAPPPSEAPVVEVGKVSASTAPDVPVAAPTTAPTAAAHGPCDAEKSFVEVTDASGTTRFDAGRELVPGRRGSKRPFAEEVIHGPGSIVFHLEGVASNGQGGHLAITLSGFSEPTAFPATSAGRVEYMPGKQSERDERSMPDATIELTAFGGVGEWVEGTFSATSATPARGPGTLPPAHGRFRVCRTADWNAKK